VIPVARKTRAPAAAILLAAAVAFASIQTAAPVGARANASTVRAARRGLAWLKTQQRRDGSLGDNVSLTAELVMAIRAAGQNPNTFSNPSPVSFLRSHVGMAVSLGVGVVGKVVLAIDAAGANPFSFGGKDLIAAIRSKSKRGRYDAQLFSQSFAMLALRASGVPAGDGAFLDVLRSQDPTGGWAFDGQPGNADTNSTAIAMQALTSTVGPLSSSPLLDLSLRRARRYLHLQQNDDAAFPYQRFSTLCLPICPSDPNSTAYVIQALVSVRHDPESHWWRVGSRGPVEALISMQAANGSFAGFSAVLATVQAIPGMVGEPFLCIAARIDC